MLAIVSTYVLCSEFLCVCVESMGLEAGEWGKKWVVRRLTKIKDTLKSSLETHLLVTYFENTTSKERVWTELYLMG